MSQKSVELKPTNKSIVHWYATTPMECSYAGLHVVYAVEYDESKYLGLRSERKLEVVTNILYIQQPHAASETVAHYFRTGLGGALRNERSQRERAAALVQSVLTNRPLLADLNVYTLIKFLEKSGIAQNEITNACTRLADRTPRASIDSAAPIHTHANLSSPISIYPHFFLLCTHRALHPTLVQARMQSIP